MDTSDARLNTLLFQIIERKNCTDSLPMPYESLLRPRRHWLRRWRLIFFYIAVFVLLVVAIIPFVKHPTRVDQVGAEITFAIGFLYPLYQYIDSLAIARLGAMNLVAGEIVGIGRVFAASNLIGAFIEQYQAALNQKPTRGGFGKSDRKENYYTMYEGNRAGLQVASPALLEHIALFYTFLKGSRDVADTIKLWDEHYPHSQKKINVVSVIYLSFLQIMNGRLALASLIDDKDQRASALDIFLGVELQCLSFLLLAIEQDDYRFPGLQARRITYKIYETAYPYYGATVNDPIVVKKCTAVLAYSASANLIAAGIA